MKLSRCVLSLLRVRRSTWILEASVGFVSEPRTILPCIALVVSTASLGEGSCASFSFTVTFAWDWSAAIANVRPPVDAAVVPDGAEAAALVGAVVAAAGVAVPGMTAVYTGVAATLTVGVAAGAVVGGIVGALAILMPWEVGVLRFAKGVTGIAVGCDCQGSSCAKLRRPMTSAATITTGMATETPIMRLRFMCGS